MIVDISKTINSRNRDVNLLSFPPSYSHVIYRATLELMSFHGYMDSTEWATSLETLREATWNYGRRWQAAGTCYGFPPGRGDGEYMYKTWLILLLHLFSEESTIRGSYTRKYAVRFTVHF